MRVKINDFILEAENAFDDNLCTDLIKFYNFRKNSKTSLHYRDAPHLVKDEAVFVNSHGEQKIGEVVFSDTEYNNLLDRFKSVFWQNIYTKYINKYPILNSVGEHTIIHFKIQKTMPSEGYHTWHPEQDGNIHNQNRLMSWILYLNDINEGGETEFIYQSKRFSPKENKFLLWPAGYTHTHRGNPPLSGTKYIMTGWVEFL